MFDDISERLCRVVLHVERPDDEIADRDGLHRPQSVRPVRFVDMARRERSPRSVDVDCPVGVFADVGRVVAVLVRYYCTDELSGVDTGSGEHRFGRCAALDNERRRFALQNVAVASRRRGYNVQLHRVTR